MAFTFDPATDRGKCRLLIHDTTTGTYGVDYDFSDADIDAALEQNGDSVWLASADLCRALAVKATSGAISISIAGAISLDKKQVAKFYMDLADQYEKRAVAGPDMVTEHVDSVAIGIDVVGQDESEYIGE